MSRTRSSETMKVCTLALFDEQVVNYISLCSALSLGKIGLLRYTKAITILLYRIMHCILDNTVLRRHSTESFFFCTCSELIMSYTILS